MRQTAVAAVVAAVLVAATEALYVAVLVDEGEGDLGRLVPTIVMAFLTFSVIALASALTFHGRTRTALLAVPAVGLIALSVPAIFSIGLPLFVAGVVAAYAAVRSRRLATPPRG